MAYNNMVDSPDNQDEKYSIQQQSKTEQALVSWIVDKVESWANHRDTNYLDKWDEYYRLWRGEWDAKDKTRDSERSRLICPALQQAIEAAVAELEEATFGKGAWFDASDDVLDQEKDDVRLLRDLLLEDLDYAKVPTEISKVFFNGSLYGTGIGKIIVEEKEETYIEPQVDPILGTTSPVPRKRVRFCVKVEAIDPREFVIDPAAKNIDDALGVGHIFSRPTHLIREKQRQGIYNDYRIGTYVDDSPLRNVEERLAHYKDDKTKIIEYYGKIPKSLLPIELTEGEEVVELFSEEESTVESILRVSDEDELIEAMVTIANDSVLLRAVENPFLMKDRSFISYQHDTVPNRFWGRGIAEKGYNPQKALDAELRARIDALALATHPMLAVDATRLPRGTNLTVRPGKVWLTNGPPREILEPFNFGTGVNAATFHQSGDLERMIQMGTGAMDSATPIGQSPRNSTASGMSMMQSGFIKRSKRTLQNISREFLEPLIQKAAWRYMQFDPERYPVYDYKFKVIASMGIMAREYEQGQLTQLLSIVAPDSPAFPVLLKGIFENSSLTNKTEMMAAVNQMLQPDPQQQQIQAMQLQLAMEQAQLENLKMRVEVEEIQSKILKNIAEANATGDQGTLERMKMQLEAVKIMQQSLQAKEKNKNEQK